MSARVSLGLSVALLLLTSSCADKNGLPEGRSLQPAAGRNIFGASPHPPEDGFVALVAFLWNVSDRTVILQEARLEGPIGLGTVVGVEGIDVAPLPGRHGERDESEALFPGGIFETYPPVWRDGGEGAPCLQQALQPIEGFRLEPQQEARLAVRIRAVARGRFEIHRHVVTYRVDGDLVQQSIEVGIRGEVAGAAHPKVDPAETSCIQETGARLY